jgi:glutamate dehydrogenase
VSEAGSPTGPLGIDIEVFQRRYLIHAASQVPNRAASELRECAYHHLALGRVRAPGQLLIKADDYSGDTTEIDIVADDAPFLIDSIRAELERAGVTIEHILHPQLLVSRDSDGVLTKVFDVEDNAEVPPEASAEAWIHIEVDSVSSEKLDGLLAELSKVLADVQYAVADRPQMYALMRQLADDLVADPGQFDRDTSAEAGELLRWFAAGNYMVLGHASYSANELAMPGLPTVAGAQGVFRGTGAISPLELIPAFRSGAPLVIFKSPLVSTVRRSARYDCVIVTTPHRGNEPSRVHAFLGLINGDEDGNVARVPVVRKRIAEVLLRSGVRASSYSARQLVSALRTLPRDELLEAPTSDLLKLAPLVVDRADRKAVGVFARTHLNRDFVTVLVYFPADRLGPETRRKVRETIQKFWPGELAARDDRIVELGLARMQFLIALRPGQASDEVDRRVVEEEVRRVTRRWSDDLADLIDVGSTSPDEAARWLRRYAGAFPEAYKEDFDASTAVSDIARLEGLGGEGTEGTEGTEGLDFAMYVPPPDDVAERRLKVYRAGPALSLAHTLPIFVQMGIEVLDERPYELHRPDGSAVWIYDFGLRFGPGSRVTTSGPDSSTSTEVFLDAIRLLWRNEIEQDGFNALIPRAGMSWWQANVLRAYAKYLRQIGTTFSQGYIEQALTENPAIAAKLVALFEARFDPERAGSNDSLVESIESDLAEVTSLDQDRIMRALLGLIRASVRTNAYQSRDPATGAPNSAVLAIKLDPRLIPDLPQPKPKHEIWVYGPRVEGVHLRFGQVARGGLRWSDRREDFRTEVLGLVKAQMVKNAVIIPVGAKGGFVGKRLPDPAIDREAWLAEGINCYQTFIGGLLDLTDNRGVGSGGSAGAQQVIPPRDVRRYDGDDPYLVVAADKGTATFSDIANRIALDRGYWLGDAFASGGSVGYDHKAMGITARGAWESVKYHFRELGLNTQEQPFTVVGIGDMSGDVFGNGMLLSDKIKLVAAFDHRHIFLDPDPDPAAAIGERRRLFELPRSSWADYNTDLISSGGGVYARDRKAIPVTAPIAARLGITADVSTLTPAEMIRAILQAPVDLLWNGGIGTYVKASSEPNAAAGDRTNDAVRVDGRELRCRVVGEGGNLGLTQLGRIEYARSGGRINTDAIDNSAGVDTSDHEVNLKILLDRAVADAAITTEQRNERLAAAEGDVAAHVLRDNYDQNVLLGVGRSTAAAMITVHGRMINALEAAGELDRTIEFLPTSAEIARRAAAGEGLTSPELAVLVAYAKIGLTAHLVDSTLPDEPWFEQTLRSYFPPALVDEFGDLLPTHPLGREITTTVVVNDMVNRAGTTFAYRVVEETGVSLAEVARAYSVVREIFDLESLWREIEALDGVVSTDAQHAGYHEIRRVIDRATRWLVDVRFPIKDVGREIARFGPSIAEQAPKLSELVCGVESTALEADTERLVEKGLPRQLSRRITELLSAFLLLDVVEIALAEQQPATDVAALHYALSNRFSVDEMLTKITALPRDDRWSALARAALRHDVYAALKAITSSVLKESEDGLVPDARIRAWEHKHSARVDRATATLDDALGRDTVDLATLSVALRVMRSLAG